MVGGREPLAQGHDVFQLRLVGGGREHGGEVGGVRAWRRAHVRALDVGEGVAHVAVVELVADEELGAGVVQSLAAGVLSANERPHPEPLFQQAQGRGNAGRAGGAGDEDAGFHLELRLLMPGRG